MPETGQTSESGAEVEAVLPTAPPADASSVSASAAAADGAGSANAASNSPPKPVAVLVIGMAGSGKTTLIQQINAQMSARGMPGYIVNLDPAVMHLPYEPNIDIRDTVKYKSVMKEYNLGPNGGILTSCNLFATRFDQVMKLLEKPRDPPLQHVVVDTPGQIEIFTWSASGSIVTELLASSFPTIVAYVVDTPRCASPQTFMSNMLQACSILYKTKLPMLLVFNKIDVTRHDFAIEWMADFESYLSALEKDASYAATLSRSLSLVLDEFYQSMKSVGVSAITGEGMGDFFERVSECAKEYNDSYVPEMEAQRAQRARREAAREDARRKGEMSKLQADMQKAAVTRPTEGRGGSSGGAIEGDDGESCDYEVDDDDIEEEDHDEDGR